MVDTHISGPYGPAARPALLRRVLTLGFLLLIGLSASAFLLTALFSPNAPFLTSGEGATWIMPDQPVAPETFLVAPGHERIASYSAPLELERVPPHARVRVRAAGSIEVAVNDGTYVLATAANACLKRTCSADIADALRVGGNRIAVRVTRKDGIPVAWFALDAGPVHLASDETWQVEVTRHEGTSVARVIRADDTRPYADSATVATPLQALASHGLLVAGLFACGIAAFLLATRIPGARVARLLPAIALVAATGFWAYVYAAKTLQIPLTTGHDARSHVHYVRTIAEQGRLPLADEGFSFYQPPLYYLASAGLVRAFGAERNSSTERRLVKLIPALAGLGMVWLSLVLSRRLFPGDDATAVFAVVAAASLPLNVYMSAYVSNEPFHAFFAAGSLVAGVRVLLADRATRGALTLLSVLLALTILSKYTGLAIAAIMLAFVALKLYAIEGRSVARTGAAVGAMLMLIGAIGGWPYLRNWIHFGDPLVWNLDLPGSMSWWQPPSFRTSAYYLHFGQSLVHPYFSLFRSFWDGMYSGVWGEGMPPSANILSERHPFWNYDLISAAYPLAFPATVLSVCGFVAIVRTALGGNDPRRSLALACVATLLYTIAFSALQLSMRFPVWGAVRATYLLSLVVPLALCTAIGLRLLDRSLAVHAPLSVRALFYGWLTAFVGLQVLAYAA